MAQQREISTQKFAQTLLWLTGGLNVFGEQFWTKIYRLSNPWLQFPSVDPQVHRLGMRITEVPIVFIEREEGYPK